MTGTSLFRITLILIMCSFSVFCKGHEMEKQDEGNMANEDKATDTIKASSETGMSDSQKKGYAMGADIGNYLKVMKEDMDLDMFVKGLKDVFEGKEILLSAEEIDQTKQQFIAKAREKQEQEMKAKAGENMKDGEAFLAENKTREGVITTESGLQYIVLKEGDGPMPKATDQVKVHYRGTRIDGTEFDSSFKRGEPATFGADRVIKGWTEALQLMKVGSKYKLFIPSELAYGDRGAGKDIPPGSTLIFEVELLAIE